MLQNFYSALGVEREIIKQLMGVILIGTGLLIGGALGEWLIGGMFEGEDF